MICHVWELETGDQFQVEQTGRQAVGEGVDGIREVFDELIRDRIRPVDQVEYFEGRPDILKVAERTMAPAIPFFAVQQEGAKTDVDPDIGVDDQGIAVFDAARDVKGQIAPVQEVQEYLQVLIGRKIVLKE